MNKTLRWIKEIFKTPRYPLSSPPSFEELRKFTNDFQGSPTDQESLRRYQVSVTFNEIQIEKLIGANDPSIIAGAVHHSREHPGVVNLLLSQIDMDKEVNSGLFAARAYHLLFERENDPVRDRWSSDCDRLIYNWKGVEPNNSFVHLVNALRYLLVGDDKATDRELQSSGNEFVFSPPFDDLRMSTIKACEIVGFSPFLSRYIALAPIFPVQFMRAFKSPSLQQISNDSIMALCDLVEDLSMSCRLMIEEFMICAIYAILEREFQRRKMPVQTGNYVREMYQMKSLTKRAGKKLRKTITGEKEMANWFDGYFVWSERYLFERELKR